VVVDLKRLANVRSEHALCAKPYLELTLSYLQADQRLAAGDVTDFNLDVTTLSALAGIGLIFQIAEGTTLRPILLGGYAHIESDSIFDGDLAQDLNEGLDGILVDANLDSFLIGGAAELRHERSFENEIALEGRLRYNHLVNIGFEASDDSLEGTNDFVVIIGKLEASVPTSLKLFSRDVNGLGFGGSNLLLEQFGESIGSGDFIYEVGGGLELKDPAFVQGIGLRGSVLFGEDVTGWRAGLRIKF